MMQILGSRRLAGVLVAGGALASTLMCSTAAFAQPGEPPPAEAAPAPAPADVAPVAPTAAPMAAPMAAPATPPPAATSAFVPAPQPPFKIESGNGSSIRIGLLLQPQFQAASSPADGVSGGSYNLFLRRTRLLFGGSLFNTFDYFVETDFANLFLANPVTTTDATTGVVTRTNLKATPGMNIQDAFGTYRGLGDVFKVDVGYMLPPLAHNAVQGAGTLYGLDYYAFTFQSGNSFGSSASPVGRDMGVQARGLVLGGHLEYRAGLFQGLRDIATDTENSSRNFFRAIGRLQINLLDPETGFFYAGTYFGAKRILSVGGSFDLQDSYRAFSGDVFADLPLGPGVFTAQVNIAHWNGNGFIPLASQTAEMGEVGYLFAALPVAPIFRFDHLSVSGGATQTRLGGGLALFAFGHNSNLKLFYSHNANSAEARSVNQVNLQWQLYFF